MRLTRRTFLQSSAAALAGCAASAAEAGARRRPNVLIIITDDQGYGDLACHGNPHLRTPNLDRLHEESVRFTNFYVSPVCSPTRSSLMTGRYNYRTGVVDTYIGRSMMHPDEVTLPECLREAGYRTGIFGKWHLGDNFPLRAMDQGFEESLVHKGGGVAQPSDPPGQTYFDPVLQHNGAPKEYKGYCTDIFTAAAMNFIREHRKEPFFAYLATNAPHVPLQVREAAAKPYLDLGLDEDTAKLYGMIENIDTNVGRILDALRDWGLDQDTLVWYLTDNGGQPVPEHPRFNAGMRGTKGTVYEGGIHVPSFVRYPAGWEGKRTIPEVAAHIDMLPTLLELCGVALPQRHTIDGVSLRPLLTGDNDSLPERSLFFQWHRGDVPELFRDCAVRKDVYKLVNGAELYNLQEDPGETTDISAAHPEVVAQLRADYEQWFKDVAAERNFAPPRIALGGPENPVVLTSQDWRGAETWGAAKQAHWEVEVWAPGTYEVVLDYVDQPLSGTGTVSIGGMKATQEFAQPSARWVFQGLELEKGPGRLEFLVETKEESKGVRYVQVRRIGAEQGPAA